MKTRTRSVTADKQGDDPQQLKPEDEKGTFPVSTSSNCAIPFFPQVDDQKPILSHLQTEEASDSDNKRNESQEVEILSAENQKYSRI